MYRLFKDFNNHKGIYCTNCKNISWNSSDARFRYCPTCQYNFKRHRENIDYERLGGSFSYWFNYFFRQERLFNNTEEDCPNCEQEIERGEIDPVIPATQSRLSVKLQKIKDPKERAKAWLEAVKQ